MQKKYECQSWQEAFDLLLKLSKEDASKICPLLGIQCQGIHCMSYYSGTFEKNWHNSLNEKGSTRFYTITVFSCSCQNPMIIGKEKLREENDYSKIAYDLVSSSFFDRPNILVLSNYAGSIRRRNRKNRRRTVLG